MSQVPPELAPHIRARYELLDTPDGVSPLNQLIQCGKVPGEVVAVLRLRDPETREVIPVTLIASEVEHERTSGAFFFGGTLESGRPIEGHFSLTPSAEDADLLGTAYITN